MLYLSMAPSRARTEEGREAGSREQRQEGGTEGRPARLRDLPTPLVSNGASLGWPPCPHLPDTLGPRVGPFLHPLPFPMVPASLHPSTWHRGVCWAE